MRSLDEANSVNDGSYILGMAEKQWKKVPDPDKVEMHRCRPIVLFNTSDGEAGREITMPDLDEIGDRHIPRDGTASVLMQKGGNYSEHHVRLSLEEFYQKVLKAEDSKCPIINMLHFPGAGEAFKEKHLETCQFAVCAISNPDHNSCQWHIDVNGVSTTSMFLSGMKVWFVAIPKDDRIAKSGLTNSFMDSVQEDAEIDCDGWWIHNLVLSGGNILIMPPNTPHLVVGLEPCLVHGQHFYNVATIRDSVFAWFHIFSGDFTIMNQTHPELWMLLVNIFGFWLCAFTTRKEYLDECKKNAHQAHLPNILRLRELNDVVCLMNLINLGSVVWFETYQPDYDMSDDERETIRLGRERVASLQEWLDTNVSISDGGQSMSFSEIASTTLGQQAAVLVLTANKKGDRDDSTASERDSGEGDCHVISGAEIRERISEDHHLASNSDFITN
ncbi:hypothetical protein K435DRAFT_877405 [Dendrothele bispora CBS 962.96]|uniref:JmjC domain-containing protein n=1 Tax=Dendrothele bispora (strain CBS 962.96) TaxID=1314807 RepID=A0A4S8KQ02_DENBC|nr:hypothetical protein K435DRAFT_877405 [Dendrothele bispora CBS 962.96]